MPEWSFRLRLNQPLTPEQADAFDHCDAFADGSVSYVLGPRGGSEYELPPPEDQLRELLCDVEAPSLIDAVARVARDVRLIPGLRAIGVGCHDTVTLDEAAQRSGRDAESLALMAKESRGPGGFPEPVSGSGHGAGNGTVFYSWPALAAYLRGLGDMVSDVPRELTLAHHALGLAHALEETTVSPGTLRAFGLPLDV